MTWKAHFFISRHEPILGSYKRNMNNTRPDHMSIIFIVQWFPRHHRLDQLFFQEIKHANVPKLVSRHDPFWRKAQRGNGSIVYAWHRLQSRNKTLCQIKNHDKRFCCSECNHVSNLETRVNSRQTYGWNDGTSQARGQIFKDSFGEWFEWHPRKYFFWAFDGRRYGKRPTRVWRSDWFCKRECWSGHGEFRDAA